MPLSGTVQRCVVGGLVAILCCQVVLAGKKRTLSNELEIPGEDNNMSTFEDPVPTRINPRRSWLGFVQHSNRNHRKGRSRKPNSNILPGPMGPPGPRGPPGPPGSPGGAVTQEVLMQEFKDMVQAEAEARAERLLEARCPGCGSLANGSASLLDLEELHVLPRVSAAFHQRLRANVPVHGRTFLELKHYFEPFGGGSFQRGQVFDPKEGRFTAPRSGIYQFSANLHVAHEGYRNRLPRMLRRSDNIRVLICIQSLCQKHTSLEYISGLESNSRTFTISVTGMLQLEGGQYTSVYVDNSSRKKVTVQGASDFSGILLGV